jgi:hypothetical protein
MTGKIITNNGAIRWRFYFTAPPAGTGPLTINVAAVDGQGGAGTTANDQDPYGDDTVQGTFSIREAGARPPPGASAGCSLAARPAAPLTPLGLLLLALGATMAAWRSSSRSRR